MNCRIVGAICQHNFAPAQTVLFSFQRKEAHYLKKKNEKIVALANYFIHPYPCFHLIFYKIRLNKTKKKASDVLTAVGLAHSTRGPNIPPII